MGLKITGLEECKRAIAKAEREVRGSLAAALYAEGLKIDAEAVQLVPVDTGRLRATHYVSPPTDERQPAVHIGYGTNYGLYVHERERVKHNPPTRDSFLRIPMERAIPGYADRIAKRTWAYYQQGTTTPMIGSTPQGPKDKGDAWQDAQRKRKAKRAAGKRKKSRRAASTKRGRTGPRGSKR